MPKMTKRKFIKIFLICLFAALLGIATTIGIVAAAGRQRLSVPVCGGSGQPVENGIVSRSFESELTVDGTRYEYNEGVISILVMGVDVEERDVIGGQSWDVEEGSQIGGGQADALFLLVLDTRRGTLSVLAINRNTMTDIDVYAEDGSFVGSQVHQICLQHGYGDGREQSCERQARAVSGLLWGIPIHGYVAVSMDAIPQLNDAVGGVEVEILETLFDPTVDIDLKKGDTVLLDGHNAYWYVRLRDKIRPNSQADRLARQKQYISAFAQTAIAKYLTSPSVIPQLYGIAQDYSVTDIGIPSYLYLAGKTLRCGFDTESVYTFDGEVIYSRDFEEFYPDPAQKQDIILRLFYEPAE